MTVTTGPDGPAPAATRPLEQPPARAEGVQMLGEMSGSGYHSAPSLARRADGQTIQLTRLLYLTLVAVDGVRSYDEIAAEVGEAYGRPVRADDVRYLVDEKLRPVGLLQRADGSEPELRRSNPLLALRLRYVIADPEVTRRVTAPFAVLFHPLIVAVVVPTFVVVCWWALFHKGLASATHQAFDRPGLLLAVFAISVLSAGFHEFGHAAAARYGGATPGAMGAGLYLIWPAFYTDVTDTYRLGRAGRLRTDLGGLYFNAICALAMFGIWWASGWDAILLVIAAQVLQMVRQLMPLVRFDGYHVLADLTGVPDLYQRIKPTLLGLLPTRWGDPETKVLKPWARAVVTLWVVLVVPLMIGIVVLMVISMPRVAATAWDSLTDRWALLTGDLGDADLPGATVQVLSMFAIVVPLAGMTYILARVVRRLTARVWRATDDRPARRIAAEATAFVVVAAVAWAWWPGNGDYRPIEAWERGTIGDAAAVVTGPPDSLRAGRGGSAQTVWPAEDDRLPTRERPVLALVLVPADGRAEAPSWVFPFDRPLPPDPGDNQALAVATEDGATVYDVAFALVWADGSILNANEAYAFASCTDCSAVAVGFQVILAVGQVDVVVPQNLSAAVNYGCVRCVTYALAKQLVVTLPEGLSSAADEQLAALWQEIGEYGERIQDVPLAELQGRLEAFERRILEIVGAEVAPAAATTTIASTPVTTAPPDREPTTTGSTAPVVVEPRPSTTAGSRPSTTAQNATTTSVAPTTTTATTATTASGPTTTSVPG